MKKLLMIIIAAILISTSLHSQSLFQVPTQYRLTDSTLILKTNYFDLITPKKVRFNGFNAVLISETQMDSINLKYLKFNLLKSQNFSLNLKTSQLLKEIEADSLKIEFLTTDNNRLKQLNSNIETQLENNQKIHNNEILYYKEKAKGKLKSFIFGTSIGALIVTILTLL